MTDLLEARASLDQLTDEDVAWIVEQFVLADVVPTNAQAMAMVKKFPMIIEPEYNEVGENSWGITCLKVNQRGRFKADSVVRYAFDLNRAIVECVANMQKAKP